MIFLRKGPEDGNMKHSSVTKPNGSNSCLLVFTFYSVPKCVNQFFSAINRDRDFFNKLSGVAYYSDFNVPLGTNVSRTYI